MFRILIKQVIEVLDMVVRELKRAYTETYELSDLSKEFMERVNEIRSKNKERFIKTAEKFFAARGLLSLQMPSYKKIREEAENKWKEALRNGDLDELFDIKERNEQW